MNPSSSCFRQIIISSRFVTIHRLFMLDLSFTETDHSCEGTTLSCKRRPELKAKKRYQALFLPNISFLNAFFGKCVDIHSVTVNVSKHQQRQVIPF
ncbi:uncharacterized protein V6R79_017422 [Siganus canaliculatus]